MVTRGKFLRWLRKIHGWLGLWGAILGLLFGVSGFLLNHRAVMKIPAVKLEETEIQLAVTAPYPSDAKAFTRFVQTSLGISAEPVKTKPEKAGKPQRDAKFMNKDIKQPQTFNIDFQLPQARIEAEYILGNQFATIKRQDANLWGFLTRMHKGVNANTGWILLVDSLAGALMVLSITGVLLWTKMRQSRLIMAGLVGTSTILAIWFTLMMI